MKKIQNARLGAVDTLQDGTRPEAAKSNGVVTQRCRNVPPVIPLVDNELFHLFGSIKLVSVRRVIDNQSFTVFAVIGRRRLVQYMCCTTMAG